MDNDRGVKSLRNDRKRILFLTKKQKKKLQEINEIKNEEELKKLEKKVKQLQIITFFKTIPLIAIGAIFKSTASTIDNLVTSNKNDSLTNENNINKNTNKSINTNENDINKDYDNTIIDENIQDDNYFTISDPIYYVEKDKTNDEHIDHEEIKNVKDKKIIKHYEEKLKEKRVEIKLLAASIPISKGTDIYYEKADEIHKKINIVLKKLEDLEQKIKVNSAIYDNNYISYLIDSYTKEFDDGKLVDEIKDSELYRDISKKINQLEDEKKKIKRLVLEKQKDLDSEEIINDETETNLYNINTISMYPEEEIKKDKDVEERIIEEEPEETDDFSFDDEKKEYDNFIDQQEHIKIEEERKETKARSELENYKLRIDAIKKQCKSLKRMIKKRSLIKPTVRNAKLVAITTLASVYNMRNILKNKKIRRRRTLRKIEYQKNIENDINEISNVSNLINKSYQQINNLILEIKEKFSSYSSIEYQSLLDDLEEIKRNLMEREYEIELVTRKQKENDIKKYRK